MNFQSPEMFKFYILKHLVNLPDTLSILSQFINKALNFLMFTLSYKNVLSSLVLFISIQKEKPKIL